LAWRAYEHQETPKLGYSVNELRVETDIFWKFDSVMCSLMCLKSFFS
jgi:hypothetical protein